MAFSVTTHRVLVEFYQPAPQGANDSRVAHGRHRLAQFCVPLSLLGLRP